MFNKYRNKKIYALKVLSTKESLAIKELERENITVLCPANRKLTVKKNMTVREELAPLLRGYIFIFVDDLTDQLHYEIKKMTSIQDIFESEIKWTEIEHLLDQESVIVETNTTELQREYKTLYGLMRQTFTKRKRKKVRSFTKEIFDSLIELKESVEEKVCDGLKIFKRSTYISIEDYQLIFR